MKIEMNLSRNEAHEFNALLMRVAQQKDRPRAASRALSEWNNAYVTAMQRGDA